MKFYKDLLGVQKQTTNIGVLLELGRVPLSIYAIKHALKNWCRLTNDAKCNELVKTSYEDSMADNLSWQNRIQCTLSQIGLMDKFLNKDGRTYTIAFQRLCDIFHQNSFSEIQNVSNKLRTYSIIKNQIGYENYLSQIQNTQNRISLTKFRLSNHCLLIETGRHQHLKVNLRFCPFCPRSIEDEFHSLLECQVYKALRNDLFIEAKNKVENFLQKGNREKFTTLLTNPTVMPYTASYLHRMFNCRDFLLKKHKNTD